MNFANWQGASSCTGFPAPGTRALLAWLLENYPQGKSMGIYNCRTVRGSTTTYSIHSEGRAVDFGLPLVNSRGNPIGYDIVNRLGSKGRLLGVQSIIFDRKIWSAASPNSRYYSGIAPHYDHLHIEQNKWAASNMTLATLRKELGSVVTPATPAVVAPVTFSTACTSKVFRLGSRGACVQSAQRRLNVLGYDSGTPDGIFGNKTLAAVRKFQSDRRLIVDGVIGPATWRALAG